MVLDNSELVATGWKEAVAEGVTISGAIGGGIGATMAFAQGSLVGTALITAAGAYGVGLFATGYAGARLGTAIGETDLVKETLLEMIESIWPIELPAPNIKINDVGPVDTPSILNFEIEINGEISDIQFYVDEPDLNAFDFQYGIDSPIELYESAIEAISNVEIIGVPDPYNYNTCGSSNVPLLIP